MVDNGQWWTMDNGGQWTMRDNVQWCTMNNGGQLAIVDNEKIGSIQQLVQRICGGELYPLYPSIGGDGVRHCLSWTLSRKVQCVSQQV